MKFGIMGAGAVGRYFGAMLVRSGIDTTFIGRKEFVQHAAEGGLCLRSGGWEQLIPIKASTDAAALSDADVVLFCVKSAATEAAGLAMKEHLKAGATVISFQNGFDNAERLSAVLNRPVIPAAIYVAVEATGPGEVTHHGRGDVIVGEGPALPDIAEVLLSAGVPTTISPVVDAALWSKLITNCAWNALSAIAEKPYGHLDTLEGVDRVMFDVIRECEEVGRRMGVQREAVDPKAILGLAKSMPAQFSSTAQDLMRGRRSEIDFLNGYVVRKGLELGVPVPANSVLHLVIKLLEARNDTSASSR